MGRVTLDSSAILALLNRREARHGDMRAAFDREGGPYIVPAAILGEALYLVDERLGQNVLLAFLEDLESTLFHLDCGEEDLPRIRELLRRYADLRLGFADAAVIACAERNGGRVLTLDVRDFSIVAREGTLTLLP